MNNNDFYKHARSDAVKWIISFSLIFVLLASMIGTWVVLLQKEAPMSESEQAFVTDGEGNPMTADMVYPMPSLMRISAMPLAEVNAAALATPTVKVQIEARVTPENATNQDVDYSVAWGEGAQRSAEPVTDYLMVTQDTDGSKTATVTCKKAFGNDTIIITVTTRDGGFTATCTVVYEGVPNRIEFFHDGKDYFSTAEIDVMAGTSDTIELRLMGELGEAGDKYGDFEIVSVTMQGRFNVKRQAIINGSVSYQETVMINLEDPKFYTYDIATMEDDQLVTIDVSEFISCSISGNILHVNALKSETAYKYPAQYPRTGTYVRYDSPYYDPRGGGNPDDCRFAVYIRDKVSGVEGMIYIDIAATAVNGVSLSQNVMEF